MKLASSLPLSDYVRVAAEEVYLESISRHPNPAVRRRYVLDWLKQLEQMTGGDHPKLVRPLCAAAESLREGGDLELARTLAERAVKIVEKRGGPNDPVLASPLRILSIIAKAEQKWDEAMQLTQRRAALTQASHQQGAETANLDAMKELLSLAVRKKDEAQIENYADQLVQAGMTLLQERKISPYEFLPGLRLAVQAYRQLGLSDRAATALKEFTAQPWFETGFVPGTRARVYLSLAEDLVESRQYALVRTQIEKMMQLLKPSQELPSHSAMAQIKIRQLSARYGNTKQRLSALAEKCASRGKQDLADYLRQCAGKFPDLPPSPQRTGPSSPVGDNTAGAEGLEDEDLLAFRPDPSLF